MMNSNKKMKIMGIISIPVMYIVLFLTIKYSGFVKFSYDLLFFATLGFIFVSLHFFLNIKKMYNWIFDHRYLIGICIFGVLVIGGYHGSSINIWNNYVNPNYEIENGNIVLGIPRGIRSDEWLVGTPYALSQVTDRVGLSNINDLINAKETKVGFYPRLIAKDLGMLMHLNQIGYLFLPVENAFSFNWYFEHFVAFFIALELLMIITKRNKLYSTLGAFLLVLSSPNLWWHTNSYMLYAGGALLIINKFINTKNIKIRILLAALLGVVAASYLSIMYPAWMIPYAYLFVLIFIWLLIENKDKIKWSDLLYLTITLIICCILFIPLYLDSKDVYEVVMNTVYPGERASYGGGGNWKLLFNYMFTMSYPFNIKISNPCEMSQYLSLFPIPIIMGIYYLIKNRKNGKKDLFLTLMTGYALFLTIWCLFPLPKFISKITLLTMSTVDRAQLVIGYACIFILIYVMSKYENKERKIMPFDKKKLMMMLGSIVTTVISILLSYKCITSAFEGSINIVVCFIPLVLFALVFYFFIQNKKKTNFILFILLMVINIVSILLIQPLDKGLEIFYDKPFAEEIRKIVSEEPDAKFLTLDEIALQNYLLPNGAKSINSTNFVPNLELWYDLDPEEKYSGIYNRYAHVFITLTNEPNYFELVQADYFKLHLNYNDICKTGANYIVTYNELEEKTEYYTKKYYEDGIYIYKTTCN